MNQPLTRDQVRCVDRIAIEEFHVPGIVLMENAGRNAAPIIRRQYFAQTGSAGGDSEAPRPNRVVVFCGSGNNGGDGLVIARHLFNCSVPVVIAPTRPDGPTTRDAATNFAICRAMNIEQADPASVALQSRDVVVDALLGTGFSGSVRKPLAAVIKRINAAPLAGVVAIDVPSGLDCDTGKASGACIRADLTITFVATKVGFATESAKPRLGTIHICDIGAPRQALQRALNE